MKKGKNFANCVFAVCFIFSALFFTSCAEGANDEVAYVAKSVESSEVPFSITVKAINSEGTDITTKGDVSNITLFVFDENNNFVKQQSVEKASILNRKSIEISCPGNETITVIAWGGLSSANEEIPYMSEANIISDLQINLKRNSGIANTASDLFYGQATLRRSSTKSNSSSGLTIERKTSAFKLTTQSLIKYMGDTKGEYIYKIKKTKSAIDYNGETTGEEVEYLLPAEFDKNGNLVSTTQAILPASEITVELYKDGNLLFSSKNDQKGENLSAPAGKQSDIVFRYSNNISTNVVVADWGTVVQYVTVG